MEDEKDNEQPEGMRRVIERPDGFYWLDEASGKQYGPFRTSLAAGLDMQGMGGDEEIEEGASLEEAEAEIGISDWIDPDTGMPAEETSIRFHGD